MDITIERADKYGDTVRPQISAVFVEGFGHWLTYFSKDTKKLACALAHMFKLEAFYVAMSGDEVAGITACTNGIISSVHLERREFTKHLGFFMGNIAFRILRKEFENHPYPFPLEQDTGSIEFVSTAARFRGKGIASALVTQIMNTTPYRSFVLEVADTNENAVKVYEKLRFAEFMRIKQKASKQSGVNNLVYMKCENV